MRKLISPSVSLKKGILGLFVFFLGLFQVSGQFIKEGKLFSCKRTLSPEELAASTQKITYTNGVDTWVCHYDDKGKFISFKNITDPTTRPKTPRPITYSPQELERIQYELEFVRRAIIRTNEKYAKKLDSISRQIGDLNNEITHSEDINKRTRKIKEEENRMREQVAGLEALRNQVLKKQEKEIANLEKVQEGKRAEDRAQYTAMINEQRAKGGNIGNGNDKPELPFFYVPDHLGSTNLVMGIDGQVLQHMEYLPSGEVFLEERNKQYNTSYKFNGKELDEAHNVYYYGARYYNPRESVWLSVDPLATYDPIRNKEHYIDGQHNGGVYNSFNLNPYIYTYHNPVRYIDPDGKQVDAVLKGATNIGKGLNPLGLMVSAIQNLFVSSPSYTDINFTDYKSSTLTNKGYTISDIRNIAKTDTRVEKVRKRDSQGSYTIIFSNGKKYHGKGKIDRMFTSAAAQSTTHGTNVKSLDWTPSKTDRDAFKAEYVRMQSDRSNDYKQGYENPINYNQRNSPGREYMKQDNDPRLPTIDPDYRK